MHYQTQEKRRTPAQPRDAKRTSVGWRYATELTLFPPFLFLFSPDNMIDTNLTVPFAIQISIPQEATKMKTKYAQPAMPRY